MSPLQAALVRIFRQGLEERGMTQADVSWRTGYSQKHISQAMVGTAEGTLEFWDAILADVGRDQYDDWR